MSTVAVICLSIAILALCASHAVMRRELHRQAKQIETLVWAQVYPDVAAEAAREVRTQLDRDMQEDR